MKKIIVLISFFMIAIPVPADVSVTENVVYGHKDGMAMIYDVLTPQKANGAGIIFMMSGGWFSNKRSSEQLIRWFHPMIDAGYTMFVVYHGSAPRYKVPEAYEDVTRAVRHIKVHANAYQVDVHRLGITGGSAGGHLSLMVGLNSDQGDRAGEDNVTRMGTEVAAVVAYYPPIDLRTIVGPSDRFPALDFDKELAAGISPILFVSDDDPPTLLIHGNKDKLVPDQNSRKIHSALEKAGVVTDLLIIDGAGHGFRDAHAVTAGQARLAWFDKHLVD
jgi:acetyl esterase/lipase